MNSERNSKKAEDRQGKIVVWLCVSVLALAVILMTAVCVMIFSEEAEKTGNDSALISSDTEVSGDESSSETESESSKPQENTAVNTALDPNFTELILVNGKNPLPEDYDYEAELITVDDKYVNGPLKQINKDIWPYMQAMIEAAWEDGIELYIRSPYRSYSTQSTLYENQVKRCMDKGLDRAVAEIEAATVVARPGTSEHHTGFAADFNLTTDGFENTEMYLWLKENAEDYGFIMRYSAEKQHITGVIHESWHWRFVGVNAAKEINRLGMCLEEYIEYLNN